MRPGGRAVAWAAWVLVSACAPPDPVPGSGGAPPGRPPDGLLDDPRLQRIVELQEERDGLALRPFLGHEDPVVRARAAFALGSVQDTDAAPELLELLHDLDPRVRADAAFAVGQLPVTGVATPLFNALKVEWDTTALLQQLEAVGKRCEEAAGNRLFQVGDDRWRAAVDRAMARCLLAGAGGEEMWSRLAEDLTHPDPDVREWAAYVFGRHPDPGEWRRHRLTLRRALATYEADDWAAMHLLRALGRVRDDLAWELMGWWVRHGTRWQIRVNAAEALGLQEMPGPMAKLLPAVDDPSVHVRLAAVQGLGTLPPGPRVVEVLTDRLRRHPGDLAVNGAILELLARLGVREPVDAWFARPDLDEEAVLMAGIRGAAALEGERGVRLLTSAAATGPPRPARAAMAELEARWQVSRVFQAARPLFFQVFTELARDGSVPVAAAARRALTDTLFAAEGMEAPGGDGAEPARTDLRRPPPYRPVDWARLRALGTAPRLHLETSRGTVVLLLRTEEAPLTVDGITALAEEGRYDGVPFHRVVPNFVVQGGDLTRGTDGEPPAFRLRSELTRVPYLRGVLGMARAGKDTETSQFFVTHSPQPHLDGGYTAFGWVVEGREVVEALAPDDRVLSARVTPGG